MTLTRRLRVLLLAVITAVLIYATQGHPKLPEVRQWKLNDASRQIQRITEILGGEFAAAQNDEKPISGDVVPAPTAAKLVEDAHKLLTADAFLPHFSAVLQLPAITLAEAKKTCSWGPDEHVNFEYGRYGDWVSKDRSEKELESRRQQWHDFVEKQMIPWSKAQDEFEGRGLVIVARSRDTMMGIKAILRALLRLEASIAVEINYWGDGMNKTKKEELSAIYPNTFFNDLSKEHNILQLKKGDNLEIDSQLKVAAVINSRWAETILVDSDNVPTIDPGVLYDSEVYKEHGSIFWPDSVRTRPQNPAWAIFNTPCRMDEYELDSSQLLVDKRRYFYHLQLAAWMNNEQGSYYNEFLPGDKDLFRFAWHALRTRYGRPKKWLATVGTVNDGFFCGHSFAQHYPDDGRIAFLHRGPVKTPDLKVMRWNRDERGGYYRNYKQAASDEDLEANVNVTINFDMAEHYPDHSVDFEGAQCMDMADVEPRELDEILPDFEEAFKGIGGYWQLDPLE
ncbi:Glycosyltransferase family 71 [Pleurostoma richardsiae]|uniref:Glycosyltransferase family 71 n=1 Tax=Pleurostoma richardsiae TaxID=41990 RepID=A0AA38VCM4_9PEZI|nr:Glycosyltransferase family 71 [Pleurostoma richardsiae]